MFKKILIVEDIDSINLGIKAILEANLEPMDIRITKYCDEALLKVKKAQMDNAPFELLITDLSFREDHRAAAIKSGEELIVAIRKEHPEIPVIVYSIEDRPYRIKTLFEKYAINAYIGKGRDSGAELIEAIASCAQKDNTYVSLHLTELLKNPALLEIDDFDVELLKYLADGYAQSDISTIFRSKGIISSSTSSIEKRINKLKIYFKANNTIHLVAIAKDFGIV